MTTRTTCPRCGNANPPDATRCLACDYVNLSGRVLSTSELQDDLESKRRLLKRARRAAERYEDDAQHWAKEINRIKAYACKHGIELNV